MVQLSDIAGCIVSLVLCVLLGIQYIFIFRLVFIFKLSFQFFNLVNNLYRKITFLFLLLPFIWILSCLVSLSWNIKRKTYLKLYVVCLLYNRYKNNIIVILIIIVVVVLIHVFIIFLLVLMRTLYNFFWQCCCYCYYHCCHSNSCYYYFSPFD